MRTMRYRASPLKTWHGAQELPIATFRRLEWAMRFSKTSFRDLPVIMASAIIPSRLEMDPSFPTAKTHPTLATKSIISRAALDSDMIKTCPRPSIILLVQRAVIALTKRAWVSDIVTP